MVPGDELAKYFPDGLSTMRMAKALIDAMKRIEALEKALADRTRKAA